MSTVAVSLVIPTYNERESIGPLVAELNTALDGLAWEAVFVDDSTDGTDLIIEAYGQSDPRVRLLHRDANRNGLAGAIVEGFAIARGNYICVLDADLQHPPQRIPDLLAEALSTGADIVIASRYVPGGSPGGLGGPLRHFYSRGLRALSRSAFPRRLASISDPLGGYFLLRRAVIEGVELRPVGYKILLEILVRCQWGSSAEVAYQFQPRQQGASKADFRQGLRFLRHLATLVWDCSPSLVRLRSASGGAAHRQGAPAVPRS